MRKVFPFFDKYQALIFDFEDFIMLFSKKTQNIMSNYVSIEKALSVVKAGQRIFFHGVAANPRFLVEKFGEYILANDIRNLEVLAFSPFGAFALADEKYANHLKINSLFISDSVRPAIDAGRASYIPVFLSEIPELFLNDLLPTDVAFFNVSPPDAHGFCTLGVSVDVAISVIKKAKVCIAQINPQMPRTHGDGFVHISKFDYAFEYDEPLPEIPPLEISEVEMQIGKHCAGLIEDGSTMQMGIGGIPNAVLANLGNHKDLGIHTEMFSDGVVPLVEKGVITGKNKVKHPGKIVACFVMGTKKVYDFIHDNPLVAMLDTNYTNEDSVIRQNPKAIAINSAIEIDLLGQVAADTIGLRQYSGIGGQMDFIRGSALSPGGKPIIALPSLTNKGQSRITALLKGGASVTTTRAHVHYVVTEYGVAYLFGKNIKQRAKALIDIAHPSHREELEKQAFERIKMYW
ncbi:MAG: acetyl-CoA hydrolase/transferase C-terminal domain-containing protein [Thermonemataceae bacterium]|nr:acetyl-CoA hydrolase/transferase C-terminal domain-containing protein [Thermonemataceae bacterium]